MQVNEYIYIYKYFQKYIYIIFVNVSKKNIVELNILRYLLFINLFI